MKHLTNANGKLVNGNNAHAPAIQSEGFNVSIWKWIVNRIVVQSKQNQSSKSVVISHQIVSSSNKIFEFSKFFISNYWNFVIGSCKGLQRSQRIYQDADYPLLIRGRKVNIYCQGMNTTNPKEYITLKGRFQIKHLLLLLFLKKKTFSKMLQITEKITPRIMSVDHVV